MAKRRVTRYARSPLMLLIVVFATRGACFAQATAFTYQGKLTDTGVPASGNYDMQFKLFDTPTVGTGIQQGATLTVPNVAVTAGIFTVQLDFGACASCFNGSARFLEIAVKKTSDPIFTTLGPRQPVTASPYAIRSLSAAAADGLSVSCVNCITSSQIQSVQGSQVTGSIAGGQISGTIPVASVPAGNTNYVQNTTSQQASANFNISGGGTAGGTLSGNIVNAATQYNIGGVRVLGVDGTNFNTFAGYFAGTSNTTGVQNSFFGYGAGFVNQTGGDNAFFGFSAGQNSTGFSNSFFGSSAGFSNTTGSENAFFGRGAGQSNTMGNNNAFFGRSAGSFNFTGTSNAFFGRSAGELNVSGSDNAFFGDLAGNANTASGNAFFGSNAGLHNTVATRNSFFGTQAGKANITGNFNAFFGYDAGFSNTSGNNSFFGFNAGLFNTAGSMNAFLGYQAGVNNTMGSRNSFFGETAGGGNTTGDANSFFGHFAGNTNTTGGGNTIVGVLADVGSNSLSNAAAIGARAQVTQSNSLVLGSINGVNGATADTSVGIGTTAPLGRLQVVTANDTNPGFITNWDSRHFVIGGEASNGGIGMSYDQTNNVGYLEALSPNVDWKNLILQSGGSNNSGRVGIGTSTPDQLLTVNGGASKPGGGSWATFSDERLKTIKGSFTTGLKAVMRLQPLRYEYKPDNALGIHANGEHVGFAAQAMERIIPEAVTKDEQGYLLLNNDPVLWTMLNAIKEQQREIEQVKGQIRRLRASVTRSVSQRRRNPESMQQPKRKRLATGQMPKRKKNQ